MSSPAATDRPDPYVAHRGLLFTVAYEMPGSAADAEDVVQEAWLRWAGLDPDVRAGVRDPRAYLVRTVTRQALNRLRTLSRRREDYVGEWLPERCTDLRHAEPGQARPLGGGDPAGALAAHDSLAGVCCLFANSSLRFRPVEH